MAKRAKVVGRCRMCGCTDDRACQGGCSWVNKEHDLCSVCDRVAWRMSAKHGRAAAAVPLYALWCPTGGDDGDGCWLCECASDGVSEAPAVFFDLDVAHEACRRENSPSVEGSLASSGFSCVVVELIAKTMVSS